MSFTYASAERETYPIHFLHSIFESKLNLTALFKCVYLHCSPAHTFNRFFNHTGCDLTNFKIIIIMIIIIIIIIITIILYFQRVTHLAKPVNLLLGFYS